MLSGWHDFRGRKSPGAYSTPVRAPILLAMRSLPIAPQPRPGAAHGVGQLLGHALFFGAALLGLCVLLRAGVGLRPELLVEPTWRSRTLSECFLGEKDEFDVVFVGSSRFLRGIDPAAFDEMTAKAGAPTRSFNYAINGMRMQEIMARVDWILEQEPARLRHLLVELTSLDPLYRTENRAGRRMVEWHTARATRDHLRVVLGSERDLETKIEDARLHLNEFGLRLGNLGLSTLVFENWKHARQAKGRVQPFNGYATPAEVNARADVVEAAQGRSAPKPKPPRRALVQEASDLTDDLPDEQAELLQEFIARVRSAGVEITFVTTPAPRYERTPGFRFDRTAGFALSKGVSDSVLSYGSRQRYAALYKPQNFVDAQHLSPQGALAFSRRLALDFVAQGAAGERD